RSGVDGRMLEVDGERQCKAVIWLESRPFSVLAFALADFHGLQDAQKLLGCSLFLQPCRAQQIHKGACAAVHDGDFFCSEIHMQIKSPSWTAAQAPLCI